MSHTISKVVYFVRHGESAHNIAPIFQPIDSPLNEKGLAQAESVAARVIRIPFEILITSPHDRAKQTAEAIEKKVGKRAEISDLFMERSKPSSIAGKSYDDPAADAVWREWEESLFNANMRVEDGENFEDIVKRADAALAYLEKRAEKTILVVTHGFFLRTLVARVLLDDLLTGEAHLRFQRSTATENTGITVLRLENARGYEKETRWRLWIYNDHAHLGII